MQKIICQDGQFLGAPVKVSLLPAIFCYIENDKLILQGKKG